MQTNARREDLQTNASREQHLHDGARQNRASGFAENSQRHREELEHAPYGDEFHIPSLGPDEPLMQDALHDLSDERCMVKRLRQLGLKQFDIQTRFAELERERRLLHERVKTEFNHRVDELREDRRTRVAEYLTTMEGGEYIRNRKDRYPACTLEEAKACIYEELVSHAKKANQRVAAEELEPHFRQAERDFQTKSRVLVQALTDIEERAAPSVETLLGQPEGQLLLRSTGFVVGLAAQARAWQDGAVKECASSSTIECGGARDGDAAGNRSAESRHYEAAAVSDAALAEARGANGDSAAGGSGVTSDARVHPRSTQQHVQDSRRMANGLGKTIAEPSGLGDSRRRGYAPAGLSQGRAPAAVVAPSSEDPLERQCGQQ